MDKRRKAVAQIHLHLQLEKTLEPCQSPLLEVVPCQQQSVEPARETLEILGRVLANQMKSFWVYDP